MTFSASVEQWRGLMSTAGGDLPIEFLLSWLQHESGGNPCSTGIPNVEAGIFQTFHPADDRFGATFTQLRAGCSGQSVTDPGAVNRSLQVQSGLNFVRGKRDAARSHLSRVGANWGENTADFWSMVKQEHALPCVASELLPLMTRKLGRPPGSWAEFRAAVMATPAAEMSVGGAPGCARFAGSPSKQGRRNRLEDTLANAEEVGKFGGSFQPGASGSSGTPGTSGAELVLAVLGLAAGAVGAFYFNRWLTAGETV